LTSRCAVAIGIAIGHRRTPLASWPQPPHPQPCAEPPHSAQGAPRSPAHMRTQ